MKSNLLMVFSLFFFLLVTADQILVLRKQKSIKLINVFSLTYGATYGLLLFTYLFLYKSMGIEVIRIIYTESDLGSLWYWFTFSVFGYISIQIVYRFAFSTDKTKKAELIQEKKKEKLSPHSFFCLQLTGIVCLVVGIISFYLWARAYGGISEFISVANAVRGGWSDVINPFAFMKHPSKIVLFSSYIFFKLIKEKHKIFLNSIFMLISLVFSFCYIMANDGRMTMAIYVVILMFMMLDLFAEQINIGKKAVAVLIIAFVSIVLILNMDAFTASIRGSEIEESGDSLAEGLTEELSYIVAAGQTSVRHWREPGSRLLLFDDLFSGIFAWLPTSLKPGNFVSIWTFNTNRYLENPDVVNTSTIPTDYISTSIYDLGVFGCIVFGLFWGLILKKLDQEKKTSRSPFFEIVYYTLAMSIFRLVNYCSLYDFILGLFNVAVAAVIWKMSAILADLMHKPR